MNIVHPHTVHFICVVLCAVICVCCCVRFRIPRTKQEIEADYVRKRITRKFRSQLRLIQNTEMDEMDLKRGKKTTLGFSNIVFI